jgi:hypothetical protein
MDNFWVGALWAVTPTALLGVVFWLIFRSILRADRTERDVYARMEAKERQRRGMPHLAVAPCQFFTLLLGPVGLLAYLLLRLALGKGRLSLDESPA